MVILLPIVIRDPLRAREGSSAVLLILFGETVTVFDPDVTVVSVPFFLVYVILYTVYPVAPPGAFGVHIPSEATWLVTSVPVVERSAVVQIKTLELFLASKATAELFWNSTEPFGTLEPEVSVPPESVPSLKLIPIDDPTDEE